MNAIAPPPKSFGRPYNGGSIGRRAGKYTLQIYDGVRVRWAGTFVTRELAEDAREKVRLAYSRGETLPAFAKAARTCSRCGRGDHNARTCPETHGTPAMKTLLSPEERGSRITDGLKRYWASARGDAARARRRWVRHPTKYIVRAPRPPACVRCFRVGHYASQCPTPPRNAPEDSL